MAPHKCGALVVLLKVLALFVTGAKPFTVALGGSPRPALGLECSAPHANSFFECAAFVPAAHVFLRGESRELCCASETKRPAERVPLGAVMAACARARRDVGCWRHGRCELASRSLETVARRSHADDAGADGDEASGANHLRVDVSFAEETAEDEALQDVVLADARALLSSVRPISRSRARALSLPPSLPPSISLCLSISLDLSRSLSISLDLALALALSLSSILPSLMHAQPTRPLLNLPCTTSSWAMARNIWFLLVLPRAQNEAV